MSGLTDDQLERYCKALQLPLVGIFLRDSNIVAPRRGENFYVFNLDKSTGNGTHWTAAYCRGGQVTYFDSFGFPPPNEITEFLKRVCTHGRVGWNSWVLQPIKSTSCGLWVLAWGAFLSGKPGDIHDLSNSFVCQFNSDFASNDRLMENFLRNLLE